MGSSTAGICNIDDFIADHVEKLFNKTHAEAYSPHAVQVRQAETRRQAADRRKERRPSSDRRQGPADRRAVASP
jgi:hypothetical protein